MIVRNMPITHVDPRTGIVSEFPAAIASAVSIALGRIISRDASALSRMLASDTPTHREETALCRAHIAINDLADFNRRESLHCSLEQILTNSTSSNERDRFGESRRCRRRYGTEADATEAHVLAAERALRDHARGLDPSQGAVRCLDRDLQGRKNGRRSYGEYVSRYAMEELEPFVLVGVSPTFSVFRRRNS